MKKINRLFVVLAVALMSFAACDVIEEPYLVGADEAKEIIEFKVDSVVGLIDQNQHTVTLDFPGGTDVSQLKPVVVVSTYATVSPASGVPQDFTTPVVYTVTAYDGSKVEYQVTAVVHDEENEKSILSFVVADPECEGVIDEVGKTVMMTFPPETDVTQLVPTIEVSAGATVNPASGEAQDFTNPVVYTVTAINGTTAEYTVTAIVQALVLEPTGKTVLLHDYTGAHCSNCPAAAEIAHGLQAQYDHLVVLSVHAGGLANPYNNNPDLRTPEGTEWFNNNTFNPAGSVNRVKLLSGYILHDSEWTDAVVEALAEPQTIEIRLANSYDETTRQLTATIDAMELEDITGDLAVTVCLMEDNIVAKQAVEGSSPNSNYVNHNVFRTTFNGAYGESMAFDDDHLFNKSFSLTLSDDYNADNCYVIAYIYEANEGMKILQTAIQKIK